MLGGSKYANSGGFTIIELSIVMAIIGGLAVIALLGQGELRSRARFTDTVDRTVSMLSSAQNSSNSTLNTNDANPGTTVGRVFFGNLVEFKQSEGTVSITQLWRESEACPVTEDLTPINRSEFEFPWAASVASADQAVVFARQCNDGRPITYVPAQGTTSGNLLRFSSIKTPTNPSDPDAPAVIKLIDGFDHCAEVSVTPVSGNISKEFVPC